MNQQIGICLGAIFKISNTVKVERFIVTRRIVSGEHHEEKTYKFEEENDQETK